MGDAPTTSDRRGQLAIGNGSDIMNPQKGRNRSELGPDVVGKGGDDSHVIPAASASAHATPKAPGGGGNAPTTSDDDEVMDIDDQPGASGLSTPVNELEVGEGVPPPLLIAPLSLRPATAPPATALPAPPRPPPPLASSPPAAALPATDEDESPLLRSLMQCTTRQALEETLRAHHQQVVFTWGDDVSTYASSLVGDARFRVHEDYLSFKHPLTSEKVKLSTHKNTVRSAAARVRKETHEVQRLEEEISERLARRDEALVRAINLEVERLIYTAYGATEQAVQEITSTIKVNMQQRRKGLHQELRRQLAADLEQEYEKFRPKRRLDADSEDEEPTAEDKAFIDRGRPKRHRPDIIEATITVNIVGDDGVAFAVKILPTALVSELKDMVAHELAVEPAKVRLQHRGRPMIDGQTLRQHQVSNNDRIKLI